MVESIELWLNHTSVILRQHAVPRVEISLSVAKSRECLSNQVFQIARATDETEIPVPDGLHAACLLNSPFDGGRQRHYGMGRPSKRRLTRPANILPRR